MNAELAPEAPSPGASRSPLPGRERMEVRVARRRSFGETMRADVWWTQPLLVFIGLSVFIIYSTWAAFQGKNYFFGNYISPFYSPEIFGDSPHSWFGTKPSWWPGWLIFSPALLVLWAPAGFRVTCYYYRGAYSKHSGLIRRRVLSVSRAKATGANDRSR